MEENRIYCKVWFHIDFNAIRNYITKDDNVAWSKRKLSYVEYIVWSILCLQNVWKIISLHTHR